MVGKSFVLMAEPGEADGSGGAVDRGDELPEVEAAAGVEATAEVEAAVEEQPRDDGGKFAKKEHSDERIPKERFNEAVGKERAAREAAEARATAAEARLKQEEKQVDLSEVNTQLKKMNEDYAALLLDGESVKAAEMMEKIQDTIERRAEMKNESRMQNATTQAVEQVRWDASVAKLEADYPALNPESEQYDQDLTDIVVAEHNRLIQTQNMSPSKALAVAAGKIFHKFMQAAAADSEGAKGLEAAKKGGDRKTEQVARNLDTAMRQPASTKLAGVDSDKKGGVLPDVSNISQAEFAALPESTKAKLRGDFL